MSNEFNFQISVNNLPQIDRHQNDAHRNPVVYQEQNAEITRDENDKRVRMPVEPDKPEGKTIDPENQRREPRRKPKKRNPSGRKNRRNEPRNRSDRGYMVDIEA